ncbi:MAG: LPXTG cell wall anchor domain-containing protein [Acidimicrobiia bacterium]
MTGIILTLLVIWLIFVVLGAVLEGLFWLTVVGIVLFLATGAYGWMKRKTGTG